jgi:hypothetical protein
MAYLGYEKRNVKLSDCQKITGLIAQRNTEVRRHSRGKTFYFYLLLEQLPERIFTFHQPSGEYDLLLYALNVGDEVTVYVVKEAFQENNTELSLIRVEKGGEVIIDQKSYEKKGNAIFWIGLGGGTISILISVWGFAKMLRRKKGFKSLANKKTVV